MATAQMQRKATSAVTFPNRVSTEQQSLVLVKRLLAISVSCITYLRGLFPECAYGTRYLDDICVKILREDKSCPGSTQLVKWMLGCYDALQKKYLRMVVLAIYTNPEDPQTITECYHFKFKYTSDGPVMDFTSNKKNDSSVMCMDIRKSSIVLVRKLYVLMQNLGPLPNDVCLTMKLFYYDEVTPLDYQPPGFKEGDCEGMMFEGDPMHLNVGEVATPFHVLKVKVTTEKERMEHLDATLLKEGGVKLPLKAIRLDKDEQKEPDQLLDEDVMSDKMEGQKNDIDSFKAEELSLTCEEDMTVKSGESHSLQAESNSQVEQLINKTSELEVSVPRTRSGKLFSNNVAGNHAQKGGKKQAAASPKASKKRSELSKMVQSFEIPCSQEEFSVPKRRRFSEPKDRF
ncbi:HORMA domain-containing protein 1 isoform X2 [Rhinatrema bivittatum]|uniref:HORMA domain-containing protein 1 isoform X2 n=1 Tax=Rhinatrema bivittatum TaxID=194408 RepID=UPI001129F78C|nr:HORMA domain-containing protein 1 isoform X2 [Rhinatrema bivittatum]